MNKEDFSLRVTSAKGRLRNDDEDTYVRAEWDVTAAPQLKGE